MFDAPADHESALTPIERGRLLRVLADGRRHEWNELAQHLFDRSAPTHVARLRSVLRSAGWRDLACALDDVGVRADPFVFLDAGRIADRLGARWRATVVPETTSTNSDLLDDVRTRPDLPLPALIAAEVQRGGRGRLGRPWRSSPGASLTVSFAIRVERRLARLDGVTLACGLAARHALAALGVDARLKWPNDLLVVGRKVAGILVEAQADPAGTVLVIGVGINLVAPSIAPAANEPSSLPWGGLTEAGAAPIDRNGLVAALALALDEHVARFDREGFAVFAPAWNAADAFRDRPVALRGATALIERGIARGVDQTGALCLESDGVRRRFIAGELSLRADAEQAA